MEPSNYIAAELALARAKKRIRKSRSRLIGWTYTISRRPDQYPEESFWGPTPEAAVLAKLKLRGPDAQLTYNGSLTGGEAVPLKR